MKSSTIPIILCKNCNLQLRKTEKERISDFKRKKFCSHSCAAKFNNKGISRHQTSIKKICQCGEKKSKQAEVCKKCYIDSGVWEKPLSYFLKDRKYSSTKLSHVRKTAKILLEKSNKKKECIFCKNEEFLPVLEVCHLKGIMTFNKNSILKEINNIDNLQWMCPSHHALYDKNLIKLAY